MKFKGLILAALGWSLGAIAQEIPASKATLSLDNVLLSEALKEINRQTGNITTAREPDSGSELVRRIEAARGNRISLNVKDQPYWNVIQEICEKKNLKFAEWTTMDGYQVHLDPNDKGKLPTFIGGACMAQLTTAEAIMTRNFRYELEPVIYMNMMMRFEPRAGVFKCARIPVIDQAVTADGVSLAPKKGKSDDPKFYDTQYPTSNPIRLDLAYKPGVKSLKTLSGKVWVIREVKVEDWVIDTDKAAGATRNVCDLDELKIIKLKLENNQIVLDMEVASATRNENLLSNYQVALRMRYEGPEQLPDVISLVESESMRTEGGKQVWSYRFTTRCWVAITQMPAKLMIRVPTEVKALQIPFEFHDVELP